MERIILYPLIINVFVVSGLLLSVQVSFFCLNFVCFCLNGFEKKTTEDPKIAPVEDVGLGVGFRKGC